MNLAIEQIKHRLNQIRNSREQHIIDIEIMNGVLFERKRFVDELDKEIADTEELLSTIVKIERGTP